MRFFIKHPNLKLYPKTYLAADSVTGASALTVKDTDGFTTTNYAVVGKLGLENTEIVRATVVTAPSTLGSLSSVTLFPHTADTPVTMCEFNQIKLYRSTSGVNGTYAYLDTANIAFDDDVTFYNDVNGLPSYYYKISYLNQNTNAESDMSDPFSGAGFSFFSLKSICERVLSLYGDTREEQITADDVAIWINEFFELAQTRLAIVTKRFNIQPFLITLESNRTDYPLPDDFLVEGAVKLSTDNGLTFQYGVPMRQLDSMGSVIQSTVKYSYIIYNGTISFDPIPQASNEVIKVLYIPSTYTMSTQSDVLPQPFANKSAMFVDYGLSRCYLKDKKFIEYQDLKNSAEGSLKDHLDFIKKISNRHPQFAEIMDTRYG